MIIPNPFGSIKVIDAPSSCAVLGKKSIFSVVRSAPNDKWLLRKTDENQKKAIDQPLAPIEHPSRIQMSSDGEWLIVLYLFKGAVIMREQTSTTTHVTLPGVVSIEPGSNWMYVVQKIPDVLSPGVYEEKLSVVIYSTGQVYPLSDLKKAPWFVDQKTKDTERMYVAGESASNHRSTAMIYVFPGIIGEKRRLPVRAIYGICNGRQRDFVIHYSSRRGTPAAITAIIPILQYKDIHHEPMTHIHDSQCDKLSPSLDTPQMKPFCIDDRLLLFVFAHGYLEIVHVHTGRPIYTMDLTHRMLRLQPDVTRAVFAGGRLTFNASNATGILCAVDIDAPVLQKRVDGLGGGHYMCMYNNGLMLFDTHYIKATSETTVHKSLSGARLKGVFDSRAGFVTTTVVAHVNTDDEIRDIRRITPLHGKFETAQLCSKAKYDKKRGNLPPELWAAVYYYISM